MSSRQEDLRRPFRRYLSKTPEITVFFWLAKLLASAAGVVLAGLLTKLLGLGITTMLVTTVSVAVVLIQLAVARYLPPRYWLAVVLISLLGSLVVDNVTEVLEVPLGAAVIALAGLLGGTYVAWYAIEKTLSIHTIDTPSREAFYWLAVLLTFALGTAAERFGVQVLGLGYGSTTLACAVVLAAAWFGHRFTRVGALILFWSAYVVTQPLGVALGSLLSEPRAAGGQGVGDGGTAAVLLAAIVAVVWYLSITHRDDPSLDNATHHAGSWPYR